MASKRYFVSRLPGKPGGGIWKVYDRELSMVYASCEFKEQANNVKDALNAQEMAKVIISINEPKGTSIDD